MKYIAFGSVSPALIYPFCSPIFSILRFLSIFYANQHNQAEHSVISAFSSSSVLLCFYMFIGVALNGFFLFLRCAKDQEDKEPKPQGMATRSSKPKFTLVTYEDKKRPVIIALLIIFFALIDCISSIFLHEISKSNPALTTIENFQIIFSIVFCFFILHLNWYKHQWLSSSLIIIGSILSVFFFEVSSYVQKIGYIFLMLMLVIFLSLQEVLEKAIFLLGKHPIELLLYEGICGIVMCLMIMSFSSILCSYGKAPIKFFERSTFSAFARINQLIFMDPINVVVLFAYVILSMLFNVFIKYANYHFVPMTRAISDTISIFITNIIHQNYYKAIDAKDNALVAIGFVVIFTGCLLLNEIIIIRCSGFENDTKEEIMKRGTKENALLTNEQKRLELENTDTNIVDDSEENEVGSVV